MSKTATQTVEETDSRRFSMSSAWSAKSEITLTPQVKYKGKYFQPSPSAIASATDRTIIEVPVHEIHMPRRKTLAVIGRMNDRLTGGVGPNEEFRLLRMPYVEYRRYWARDERGNYLGTEPEGMGHERLRAQGW